MNSFKEEVQNYEKTIDTLGNYISEVKSFCGWYFTKLLFSGIRSFFLVIILTILSIKSLSGIYYSIQNTIQDLNTYVEKLGKVVECKIKIYYKIEITKFRECDKAMHEINFLKRIFGYSQYSYSPDSLIEAELMLIKSISENGIYINPNEIINYFENKKLEYNDMPGSEIKLFTKPSKFSESSGKVSNEYISTHIGSFNISNEKIINFSIPLICTLRENDSGAKNHCIIGKNLNKSDYYYNIHCIKNGKKLVSSLDSCD